MAPALFSVYTLPQKKGNFRKLAFLLGKSVNLPSAIEGNHPQISRNCSNWNVFLHLLQFANLLNPVCVNINGRRPIFPNGSEWIGRLKRVTSLHLRVKAIWYRRQLPPDQMELIQSRLFECLPTVLIEQSLFASITINGEIWTIFIAVMKSRHTLRSNRLNGLWT